MDNVFFVLKGLANGERDEIATAANGDEPLADGWYYSDLNDENEPRGPYANRWEAEKANVWSIKEAFEDAGVNFLRSWASGKFRPLNSYEQESFSGAGPQAVIWHDRGATIVLDPAGERVGLPLAFFHVGGWFAAINLASNEIEDPYEAA